MIPAFLYTRNFFAWQVINYCVQVFLSFMRITNSSNNDQCKYSFLIENSDFSCKFESSHLSFRWGSFFLFRIDLYGASVSLGSFEVWTALKRAPEIPYISLTQWTSSTRFKPNTIVWLLCNCDVACVRWKTATLNKTLAMKPICIIGFSILFLFRESWGYVRNILHIFCRVPWRLEVSDNVLLFAPSSYLLGELIFSVYFFCMVQSLLD